MTAITQWVRHIIFIILFTALLEMFLPENKMRKYIRIVMGFFIITMMISPFTAIFNQDFTAIQNLIPDRIIAEDWDLIEEEGDRVSDNNQALLTDYYEDRIGSKVKELVNLNFQDYKQDIKVNLDNEYMIESMQIVLKTSEIKAVEEVRINISNEKEAEGEEKQDLNNEEMIKIQNLKNNISQVFQINTDKIDIILQKKEG
ncbi:MAG: stage III sporulation protein AF [bacterium]